MYLFQQSTHFHQFLLGFRFSKKKHRRRSKRVTLEIDKNGPF